MTDKKTTDKKTADKAKATADKAKATEAKREAARTEKAEKKLAAFHKKYKQVVVGSVREPTKKDLTAFEKDGKVVHSMVCDIKCVDTGDKRTINVQDAFQVFRTVDAQNAFLRKRRAKKSSTKKAAKKAAKKETKKTPAKKPPAKKPTAKPAVTKPTPLKPATVGPTKAAG